MDLFIFITAIDMYQAMDNLETICNTKGELRRLLSRVEHLSYNKDENTELKDKLILKINKKYQLYV